MTYEIEIELADVIGPALANLQGKAEDLVNDFIGILLDHRETVDLDQLLADRQTVALVWDVGHVRDLRPDLTDEQAWATLEEARRLWDRQSDPMRETIRRVAARSFPGPTDKAALRARLERLGRLIESLPEDEIANPDAFGSAAANLNAVERLLNGERS